MFIAPAQVRTTVNLMLAGKPRHSHAHVIDTTPFDTEGHAVRVPSGNQIALPQTLLSLGIGIKRRGPSLKSQLN